MNCSYIEGAIAPLLGMRELDIIHPWPNSWQGISFKCLLPWILKTKKSTKLSPPAVNAMPWSGLSKQQCDGTE